MPARDEKLNLKYELKITIKDIWPPVWRRVRVAGKRQGPPEDCGGPWGYAEFLEAIGDAQHERHEELVDWIGGGFDPEAFDLEAVNRNLAALRAPRGGRGGCAERF